MRFLSTLFGRRSASGTLAVDRIRLQLGRDRAANFERAMNLIRDDVIRSIARHARASDVRVRRGLSSKMEVVEIICDLSPGS